MPEQIIGNFKANYPDGTETTVLVFQSTVAGEPLGGNRNYGPIIRRLETENGVPLNRISKGRYNMKDCQLTSYDPDCP